MDLWKTLGSLRSRTSFVRGALIAAGCIAAALRAVTDQRFQLWHQLLPSFDRNRIEALTSEQIENRLAVLFEVLLFLTLLLLSQAREVSLGFGDSLSE
ncbi:hypothetical protein [Burkholderia sp. LMG 32019]|uniref:hypothetical protein n=1 Tax=Burkholderia sp. LMG 32019 TaxID=3158173 RepID=UPI003C2B14FC